jgi:hypothetical protein
MGPTRKELLEHIVALIVATQDLARATEESTREYRALRQDIARLGRRSRAERHPRLIRVRGARTPVTVTALPAPRPD